MSIQLSSSAFKDGETIPKKYSCDGENLSPPLSWGELPQGTRSLALIMDDPDAPVGTFVHWVLFDLPADLSGFPEGGPAGGTDGTNSTRKGGYTGPCPPRGSIHRYYFKLYALDQLLSLETGATKAEVEQTMRDHVLGQGQLMGRFGR